MKTNTDPLKIKEILTRGVEKIYPNFELLEKKLLSGERLKIYCGFDPSSSSLHVGNMVILKKLRQFQSLGHEVIMLIGDFTGMIGDPTDKKAVRKKLTRKMVLENSKNYKKLASKIIKFKGSNPAQILYNSKWLDSLTFYKLIELASNFTVQQMIVRDMFQERIRKKKPIFLHEFLYPLAQAYDSVAMNIDLEVGGKDQIFNMLCGSGLMKVLKNKKKFILATKLLVDPLGKKMGKTEGNVVNMNDKPEEIFGKVMSWPDNIITIAFEVCTNLSLKEIDKISNQIKIKKINPRDAKARLAKEIVAVCYNKKTAERAEKNFEEVFKKKKVPQKISEFKIKESFLKIIDLLPKIKIASSKSEAKRLILQGGVKINGEVQKDWRKKIKIKKGLIVQLGKRKFIKIEH